MDDDTYKNLAPADKWDGWNKWANACIDQRMATVYKKQITEAVAEFVCTYTGEKLRELRKAAEHSQRQVMLSNFEIKKLREEIAGLRTDAAIERSVRAEINNLPAMNKSGSGYLG